MLLTARLCRETSLVTQTLDTSEQELEGPVPGPGGISWQFMTRQLNLVVRQAPLIAPVANNTSLAEPSPIVFLMVGHKELVVLRIALETLETIPCDILESKQSTIWREQEVQATRTNDGVVGVFDDTGEDRVLRGGEGSVTGIGIGITASKHIARRALEPADVASVDCVFDIGTIEVDFSTRRRVVTLLYTVSKYHTKRMGQMDQRRTGLTMPR